MNAKTLAFLSGVVLVLGTAATTLGAGPSTTAFTYQGELKQSGELAQGVFDLSLELYDLPVDGNLLGTVTLAGVEVRDGVFTVVVDFGLPPPGCGVQRFLETHVRPAGGDEFTPLLPRQPLKSKADCTVDGSLTVNGNIQLPPTSESGGVLWLGGSPFLHGFGWSNTFVGMDAGNLSTSGWENTAVGYWSLALNTTGSYNTAIGTSAMSENTAGSKNVAVGRVALGVQSFDPGYPYDTYNTAVGYLALMNNNPTSTDNGIGNTAVGSISAHSNTTGRDNAAFGNAALVANTTGSYNTAIGNIALNSLDGGDSNVALGFQAGTDLTSGSNNILIGNPGISVESNAIRIGNSMSTATYIAGIYGTPIDGQAVYISSNGQLGYQSSSSRRKHDIVDMAHESDVLMRLRPVAFYYRPEIDAERVRRYGLVAEEVAEIAPALVINSPTGEPESVRYDSVNAMLLNEVQKQRRVIESLEARLAAVEAQLEALAGGATSAE